MSIEALLLIFELIEKTAKLAPEVSELIRKAKSGEAITVEEIQRAEDQVNAATSGWDNACKDGE